ISRTEAGPRAEPHPGGTIVVAIIVAELLGADPIEQRRDHRHVRHVPHLSVYGQLESVGGGERDDACARAVRESVAAEPAQLEAVVRCAPHEPGADREAFHAVDVDQLAQRAGAEALALEAGERASPRDATDFGAHPLEVVLADRLGDVLDRCAEWCAPGKRVALNLGKRRDFLPPETNVRAAEGSKV